MAAPTLLTTEVAGLDTVLGGGIPAAALGFIVGRPGAGKTVLATQILFHALHAGAPALLLSTYSEGHEKLVQHLRPFAFFDAQLLGGPLTVLALPSLLGPDAEAAARTLFQAVRQTGARLVVLDGVQALQGRFPDPTALPRLFATLSSQLPYLQVTLLVTLEGSGWDPALASFLTTADVVLGLDYGVAGLRHTRYLEVIKQRGLAPLPGLHPYTITADGLTVYPRLEARPRPSPRAQLPDRAAFGLPELDRLLAGGLTAGTVTLLAGAPGVGKTTLALQWALTAARAEHATVFLGFAERAEQLHAKAAFVGLDVDAAVAAGALRLIREAPGELDPDVIATHLLDALTPAVRRVVIDDIAGLIQMLGSRAGAYLAVLADHLYAAGVSSLVLLEIEPLVGLRLDLAGTPLATVAENVLVVQQERAAGALHRVLAVLKMRYSGYDRTLRELLLDGAGVRVVPAGESTPEVLHGAAEASGGFAPPRTKPAAGGRRDAAPG